MKTIVDKMSLLALLIGLAMSLIIANFWAEPFDLLALVAGYVLFSLNYFGLKFVGNTLIVMALAGNHGKYARLWVSLGSLVKFVGLIGALYVLLVVWQLSGFYLALGAFISLIFLVGFQGLTYLRSLMQVPESSTQTK